MSGDSLLSDISAKGKSFLDKVFTKLMPPFKFTKKDASVEVEQSDGESSSKYSFSEYRDLSVNIENNSDVKDNPVLPEPLETVISGPKDPINESYGSSSTTLPVNEELSLIVVASDGEQASKKTLEK